MFQAASTLITASASHVNLINGAQPCNVFWQVGSSATLGTTTDLRGQHHRPDVDLAEQRRDPPGAGAGAQRRVTLINDTITAAHCATSGGGGTTPGGTTPGGTAPGGTAPGGGGGIGPTASNGTSIFSTIPRSIGNSVSSFGVSRCVQDTFPVRVTGVNIRRVVFSLDGLTIANRRTAPFRAVVRSRRGIHIVRARVLYTDATPASTLRMRFRACAEGRARVPSRRVRFLTPRTTVGFTG